MSRQMEELYGAHMDELTRAMMAAIQDAHLVHDAHADEYYITSVECDGQYATITVGVSNVADHKVVVNVDTGQLVSRFEEERLPAFRVVVEYETRAEDEEAALANVRAQLYRDDDLGHVHDEPRLDYIVRSVL